MFIKYCSTYIEFKHVIKLKRDIEKTVKFVDQGWFKPKKKVETVKHILVFHYIDHVNKEREFTWHSDNEQDVRKAYDEIAKQLEVQRNEMVDKTIEKALMGSE